MPKHAQSMSFIQWIWNASLDDGMGLTGESLDRLRNPPKRVLKLDNLCQKLAIRNFMALEHSLEHQQNSTFATPSFDISHEQFSFYSQTQYVKSLFLIQRRFSEIFRQGL